MSIPSKVVFVRTDGSKIKFDTNKIRFITKELEDEEENPYVKIVVSTYGDINKKHQSEKTDLHRVYGTIVIITMFWDPKTDKYYKYEYKKNEILNQDDIFIRLFRHKALNGGVKLGFTKKIGFFHSRLRPKEWKCVRKATTWIIMTKVGENEKGEVWVNGKYIQFHIYSKYYRQWLSTEKFQVDEGNIEWERGEKERLLLKLRNIEISKREIIKTVLKNDTMKSIQKIIDKEEFPYYPTEDVTRKLHKKYLINQGELALEDAIEMDGFFDRVDGSKKYL